MVMMICFVIASTTSLLNILSTNHDAQNHPRVTTLHPSCSNMMCNDVLSSKIAVVIRHVFSTNLYYLHIRLSDVLFMRVSSCTSTLMHLSILIITPASVMSCRVGNYSWMRCWRTWWKRCAEINSKKWWRCYFNGRHDNQTGGAVFTLSNQTARLPIIMIALTKSICIIVKQPAATIVR